MNKISTTFGKIKAKFVAFASNPSFTLKEQAGYASGAFGGAMGTDMLATFITIFLVDFTGIDSGMVISLMATAKIVNIIGDPIAGRILDTGRGKVKPFLLIAPFPLAVTSILMFVVPAASMTIRLVWVFAFYIIYSISDTFYGMSLSTMSVRMTNNPEDRKSFYAVAQVASSLGSTLPGGVVPLFISAFKDNYAAQQNTYLIAAVIFGVVALGTMIVPYFTLSEKFSNPVVLDKVPVQLNFKAIINNRPLLLLTSATIVDSIRQVCYGALAFFFLKTLGAFWMSTAVGVVSSILSYVSVALVPIVGRKFSARDMMVGSYFFTGVCYVLLLLIGYNSLFIVGALIGIAGFPNGMLSTSRRILLADSTDYMEWKTWKKFGAPVRSDGMVMAVHSMGSRMCGFWKDLLLPAGLTLIGYVSATVLPDGTTVEVTQSAETLRGIFYLVTIPGIIGNILPGLILLFDNFSGKKRTDILEELYAMRREKAEELGLAAAEAAAESGGTAES